MSVIYKFAAWHKEAVEELNRRHDERVKDADGREKILIESIHSTVESLACAPAERISDIADKVRVLTSGIEFFEASDVEYLGDSLQRLMASIVRDLQDLA